MSVLEFIIAAVVVTVTMFGVDFAHSRYVTALVANRRDVAARWTVIQGAASAVGFVLAIKMTLWLIPFELLGLYLGTRFGIFRD